MHIKFLFPAEVTDAHLVTSFPSLSRADESASLRQEDRNQGLFMFDADTGQGDWTFDPSLLVTDD